MTLKLLTFDLDDTLWPVAPVIQRAEQIGYQWLSEQHPEVTARYGIPEFMALRMQTLKDNPELQHNLTALRKTAMQKIFIEVGHSERDARLYSEAAFEIFHDARNQVTLFPEVRPMLETLAERYVLGSLTNGNADLNRIGLGDLFAFQHSAESVGRRKPEPDIFLAALKSAGVNASQALHIGDHPQEDVSAARAHGFHSAWANLLRRDWPAELVAPEYQFTRWSQLPELLEKIDTRS